MDKEKNKDQVGYGFDLWSCLFCSVKNQSHRYLDIKGKVKILESVKSNSEDCGCVRALTLVSSE